MNIVASLLFFLSVALSCGGNQENQNIENSLETSVSEEETAIPAEETQNTLPVGEMDKKDLLEPPHSSWFKPNLENYEPDSEAMKVIKTNLPEYEVKIFMGTWCSDSKREVPKFYKILELADYDMEKVALYGMDRQKTTPKNLQDVYDIKRVPTIIFYQNGEETNRFVEYPQETMEEDIAKIVSGEMYEHSYFN